MDFWSEVHNTYFSSDVNDKDGDLLASIAIDAWKTSDENEQGNVIARVLLSKHGDILVDYHDNLARYDEMAQAAIVQAKDQLRAHYLEFSKDNSKVSEQVSCLCEEYEGDDGIRAFQILAVSQDKEHLRELMEAKILRDEYGYIANNGIDTHDKDHFMTEFNDGFVEYSITDVKVLSHGELELLVAGELGKDADLIQNAKKPLVVTDQGIEELYLGFRSEDNFKNHPQRVCYVPENWDFDNGNGYTGQDFINLCDGDIHKAQILFEQCDWQHPETVLDEWSREEEAEFDEDVRNEEGPIISVQTKLGTIVAGIKSDPDYPGIYIDLQGPGLNAKYEKDTVGLAWVEFEPNKEKIQTVVYGNGEAEEHTHLVEHENVLAPVKEKTSLALQIQSAQERAGGPASSNIASKDDREAPARDNYI